MTNEVKFKVSGGELAAYMDSLQRKSQSITNDAIKGALSQIESGKQQILIINETISAIERKNRIEAQAAKSILQARRDQAIADNRENYNDKRDLIDRSSGLNSSQKNERYAALDIAEKESEERIKKQYSDELQTHKEQEKQAKLSVQLSREAIREARIAAEEQRREIRKGNTTLGEVRRVASASGEEEKLTASILEEQLERDRIQEEKEKRRRVKEESEKGNITKGILSVDNLNTILKGVGQVSQTKNGFDIIGSSARTAGTLIGSIFGETVGKVVGEIFGTGGELIERRGITGQNYLKQVYRYNALTGEEFSGNTNMNEVGVTATDYLKTQIEFARKRGYATESDKTARESIYLEKGFGIDQSTSLAIVELQRSSKENNRDLAGLIGGILERGQRDIFKKDHTFLNEFLGKFSTLQKELLKTNATVQSGLTMDVLRQFNSLGGGFEARDSRSSDYISSINQTLSNPSSDNTKAISYRILSRLYPNKGIFDLQEEMEKGLASPQYLKGIMDFVGERSGGDDQMRMTHLSGFFKGLPKHAIRSMYKGWSSGKLHRFDQSELSSLGFSDDMLRGKAEANTTVLDKNTAEIETKLLAGVFDSFKSMVSSYKEALSTSLQGAVITINDGKGTIEFKGNQSRKPK